MFAELIVLFFRDTVSRIIGVNFASQNLILQCYSLNNYKSLFTRSVCILVMYAVDLMCFLVFFLCRICVCQSPSDGEGCCKGHWRRPQRQQLPVHKWEVCHHKEYWSNFTPFQKTFSVNLFFINVKVQKKCWLNSASFILDVWLGWITCNVISSWIGCCRWVYHHFK